MRSRAVSKGSASIVIFLREGFDHFVIKTEIKAFRDLALGVIRS